MATRSAAHHEADARRTLKGREAEWLRGYMSRHALRILVADQELKDQGHASELSPALALALKSMRGQASISTGRQYAEV